MTNRNQPIEPDGVAPPMGPHTHAWRVPAGAEWLYISGQVAVDQSGQVVGPGDIGAQVQQVFRNVEGVLVGAGFEFADVVKFTTYLVRAEDMEAYRKARAAVYDSCFPDERFPASTLVVVSRLAIPELLVEVEAVAARSP